MSAYKQFLTSDIIITPLELHKSFTFVGDTALTASNVGIDRFLGVNVDDTLFNPLSAFTTGQISTQYQKLIYESAKELYYSNYLSSSYGDSINLPILIPGRDEEGNRLIGATTNPQYYNYPQTTLTYPKYFPTSSHATIGIISIPVRLFGDYIQPNSFVFTSNDKILTDDGEGNILFSGSIVGNIFYPHGIITLTGNTSSYGYGVLAYGSGIYGGGFAGNIINFITSSNVTCSFSSSYTIYESQYKCTIRENEFNSTLNPSTLSGSNGIPFGYVTESYFNPYITTVGLYDEQQNLLAVGKLAQPLPGSPTTDTTILINIDR